MDREILTRSQMNAADTWRLEDIFERAEDWESAFKRAEELTGQFAEKYQGRLGDPETLKAALNELYALNLQVERIYTYARMRRDEDNALAESQARAARAQSLYVSLSAASSFISPELLEQPEDYINEVIGREGFEDYKVYLGELERQRPHTLSAREERLIAMSGEMGSAPGTIYDMLTDADMKFPTITGEDGAPVEVTQSGFVPLMMSRTPEVRRAAFEALYTTYRSFSSTIPTIYESSVKADIYYSRTANFASSRAARLFSDNIPESVYDNLVDSINRHLPTLNKFVSRNGELIGASPMSVVDLYVPAIEGFDISLPYDEAYDVVVDCLAPLGEEYQQVLRRAKAERWIDPYENTGKSSGAYSWGTYDTHPYVLLNYKPNLDSLLTIAHEMGHSMHSYYSNAAQPYPTADYALFVAEVASTCNEIIVLRALMARYSGDPEAQAYLTYHLLDSFRTTVFRQTMFAEFERETHAMSERGEALTGESLNALYSGLNKKYYGSIEQNPLLDYEWMRIPHFYRAFYVYQYATGFTAAMALAAGILSEGAPAVERYKRFLSAGSSVYPIDALKIAGVDMSEPESVERALGEFDALVEKYLELTAKA